MKNLISATELFCCKFFFTFRWPLFSVFPQRVAFSLFVKSRWHERLAVCRNARDGCVHQAEVPAPVVLPALTRSKRTATYLSRGAWGRAACSYGPASNKVLLMVNWMSVRPILHFLRGVSAATAATNGGTAFLIFHTAPFSAVWPRPS